MSTVHGGTKGKSRASHITQTWKKYKKTHDDTYRNRLIEHYMYLVESAAKREHSKLPGKVELSDLISAGVSGLMDAVKSFEPARGFKFTTYSSPRIHGSIIDWLREMDFAPRLVRDRARKWAEATESLKASLGRKPTDEEIAQKMGIDLHELKKVKKDANTIGFLSLDNKYINDKQGNDICELDIIKDKKAKNPLTEAQKRDLKKLITKNLTASEALIIVLYYYEGLTMKEIGLTLGISESRVCQVHASVLARLKSQVDILKKNL
jgi:RNA polymerase sigma factor for flagellar operon FliA